MIPCNSKFVVAVILHVVTVFAANYKFNCKSTAASLGRLEVASTGDLYGGGIDTEARSRT
ncbi:hypothetical protein PF005_g30302 [Phytophthora fragariae]|uniref:Pectate lyase n=1 Tax=Phytophthora fragariae TaxID=53985 RepID=A0A6A3R3E2_9STRA|nr:hypothetical protein PF003_g30266 [Phytophthora fragariae]KAE8922913.1 hypothetical protein PF009_g26827 [Phytophthora fragariae]KAE9062671.1 hypothetical protein PF010_g29304 [Phytophthora fragariae]KAE9072510.1 hypothetical protein PF007_g26147 [Phytophthora fragariae]KAE9088604.1 hypothetical protein PF006_g25539 [Phytophthora fragariae]